MIPLCPIKWLDKWFVIYEKKRKININVEELYQFCCDFSKPIV